MTIDTYMAYMGDGGTWHPVDGGTDPASTGYGATVRDYFAAHAPDYPPPWFQIEPHMPKPKPLTADGALRAQPEWTDLNEGDRQILTNWMGDGIFELEGNLAPIGAAARDLLYQRQAATTNWENRYEQDRFFAWRWYYADRMLRGRRD